MYQMSAVKKVISQQSILHPLCVAIEQLIATVQRSDEGDIMSIIYRDPLVTFLQREHNAGRSLYLTVGDDREVANSVQQQLALFTGLVGEQNGASSAAVSLGDMLLKTFGRKNFDFLGDLRGSGDIALLANQAYALSGSGQVEALSLELAEQSMFAEAAGRPRGTIVDYISIARPDHWFKNMFVLPGVFLVPFFFPLAFSPALLGGVMLSLAAVCLVASSNYVINEVIDAPQDRFHPVKRNRPVAAGRIALPIAYAEWIALGCLGIGLGFVVNKSVGCTLALLWIMGCIYNIRPIRSKELPYLDVLSESLNNPLRMAVGWYATGVAIMPPISALFAYWMLGAFLMASKRFAEYRRIADPKAAAMYRSSFCFYNDERLMASMVAYVAMFMMGAMAFVMLYRLELVFAIPAAAYLFAYYVHLSFRDNSPVQYPELLYRERHLATGVVFTVILCLALFFMVDLPWFKDIFQLLTPHA